MDSQSLTGRDLRNAILFGALVYLAIRFVTQIADILLILSVSALVTVALSPAVTWLQKRKFPRQASAGVLALAVIGLVVLGSYLIIPRAGEQLRELIKQGPTYVEKAQRWVDRTGIKQYVPDSIDTSNLGAITKPLITGASRATASAAGAIAGAFLVLIITVYLLANPAPVIEGFILAVSPEHRKRAHAAGVRLATQIRAWAAGILIGMFFIFVVTWIALAIIGMKQAFLFAVIAGLLEAVPVIGPILSAVPPLVVALLSGNPITAIWVALAFIGIQQFEGNLLIPVIMSRQLSMHPVTVIFAVLVMGGLFGIVGIFLAAPAAVTAGIIYDEFYLKPREEACLRDRASEGTTD